MPAMDYINKTDETVHDISAAATKSTAAVNMARAALPVNGTCVVLVTAISAVDFQTRQPRAYFEYTTDNGTTWRRGGACELKVSSTGIPLQHREMAVKLDHVPEQNAPDDIDWRVTVDIGTTIADADDFSFQAYLGAPTGATAVID